MAFRVSLNLLEKIGELMSQPKKLNNNEFFSLSKNMNSGFNNHASSQQLEDNQVHSFPNADFSMNNIDPNLPSLFNPFSTFCPENQVASKPIESNNCAHKPVAIDLSPNETNATMEPIIQPQVSNDMPIETNGDSATEVRSIEQPVSKSRRKSKPVNNRWLDNFDHCSVDDNSLIPSISGASGMAASPVPPPAGAPTIPLPTPSAIAVGPTAPQTVAAQSAPPVPPQIQPPLQSVAASGDEDCLLPDAALSRKAAEDRHLNQLLDECEVPTPVGGTPSKKLYKCKFCGKLYDIKSSIRYHLRIIHLKVHLRAAEMQCAYCSRRFTCAAAAQKHQQRCARMSDGPLPGASPSAQALQAPPHTMEQQQQLVMSTTAVHSAVQQSSVKTEMLVLKPSPPNSTGVPDAPLGVANATIGQEPSPNDNNQVMGMMAEDSQSSAVYMPSL